MQLVKVRLFLLHFQHLNLRLELLQLLLKILALFHVLDPAGAQRAQCKSIVAEAACINNNNNVLSYIDKALMPFTPLSDAHMSLCR